MTMIALFQRIDRAWARFEGWLTVGVMILMVLVAAFQAGIRNLTRFDIQWANALLTEMDWADSLLRKGTLWLAFLGASLAAHYHKHIAIDSLLRAAPPRAKYWMLGISTFLAGLITLGLTYAFWSAVHLNLAERPVEYEMLADSGSIHVCDATAAQLKELVDFQRPTYFCAFRSLMGLFGFTAETPGAAFQIIVPVAFFVIGLRLLAQGIGYFRVLHGGEPAIEHAEAQEQARIAKQQESVQRAVMADSIPAEASENDGGNS
jgi:TRAP-type C4-dicarboxylate transport system permease small subunit